MVKLPFIEKISSGDIDFRSRNRFNIGLYFFLYSVAAFLFFFILFGRLFHLTVVKGDYYRRLSDENRVKEIAIEPLRGSIMDRYGRIVVANQKGNVHSLDTRITSRRTYDDPQAGAHIIGYRQLASPQDLKDDACFSKIRLGSRIGKQGLERVYECELRGKYGKKLVEVDAHGRFQRTLTVIPPIPGANLHLTLDWELQKAAYKAIEGKKAAVVALNPQNGEILALTSSPSFSLQDFEDNKQEKISAYLKDPDKPLFDRVLEGVYPPGSVFKLVVAAGALEEKAIDEHTQFEDTGTIRAGAVTFGNWYFLEHGKKDGMVDIIKGLRRSNDIFFYHTGAKLGVDKIRSWGERFGYGRAIDIPLSASEGTIPSPFWKEEVIGDNWYLGDTYNLSIGQGYLEVSPFHVAQATAPFANGGRLCKPLLTQDAKPKCKLVHLSKKTLDLVRQGMREACSPGGTGWPLFQFSVVRPPADGQLSEEVTKKYRDAKSASEEAKLITDNRLPTTDIPVACKTGTAESHRPSGIPHAWFTAFAPLDKPEIVVGVMVEEGGQGSDVAGPIARQVLKAYFSRSQ